MAARSLMRYRTEEPWFPTALLPSEGVACAAIDDISARATRTDAGSTVAVDLRIRRQGVLIPAAGDVEWVTPRGALPYRRGRVAAVAYALALCPGALGGRVRRHGRAVRRRRPPGRPSAR